MHTYNIIFCTQYDMYIFSRNNTCDTACTWWSVAQTGLPVIVDLLMQQAAK